MKLTQRLLNQLCKQVYKRNCPVLEAPSYVIKMSAVVCVSTLYYSQIYFTTTTSSERRTKQKSMCDLSYVYVFVICYKWGDLKVRGLLETISQWRAMKVQIVFHNKRGFVDIKQGLFSSERERKRKTSPPLENGGSRSGTVNYLSSLRYFHVIFHVFSSVEPPS